MPSVTTTDTITFDEIFNEGRKRGYVRRADLEAAVRHQATARREVTHDEKHVHADTSASSGEAHLDLETAIDRLLADDVDIIDDDEEASVQEDEAIESSIKAMETDSAPLVDMPDESEAGEARLRRVHEVARAVERGEATEVDAITAYLREIGRVPMLSHAQEIDLAHDKTFEFGANAEIRGVLMAQVLMSEAADRHN